MHLARKMEETRLCTPSLLLERETESNCHLREFITRPSTLCVMFTGPSFFFEDSKDYDAVSVDRELYFL